MSEELFRNIRLIIANEYFTETWQLITEVLDMVTNDKAEIDGEKIIAKLLRAWFSLLDGIKYVVDHATGNPKELNTESKPT